jgi:acetolactate synthase-1/2/3 large subunit
MKKTGAEIVIEALKAQGVDLVFGYPGGAIMPVYDEIYKSDLKHILSRHEQGACHAADAYARTTGKPGVVFATSGPGATNLVTGLATAHMDSSPIVAITGQVTTSAIGTDAFQEADIYGISIPVTKYNYLVKHIGDLSEVIAEAFYIARTGRPGPVLIDIPKDVQFAACEYIQPDTVPLLKYVAEPHHVYDTELDQFVDLLQQAERPVIYVGGGAIISDASNAIRQLAQKTSTPVTCTLTANGVFPSDDELALGMPGMHGTRYANEALDNADLVIAAGTRFDDRVTGKVSNFVKNATIVHIDIDPAEIGKVKHAHLAITGNLRDVLEALLTKLEGVDIDPHTAWRQQINEWKAQFPLVYEHSDTVVKPQYVIEQISELTNGDAIITTGVGQHQMWASLFYTFRHPRSFVTSGGLGTMGYGFPASIGAQIGNPDKTVFAITGDGSVQMNIQELATVSYYNIPVKVVILNNGFLGMVRQWQELFFERRYAETHLAHGNPDFVAVAKGYGVEGLRITKPEEVRPVLEQALAIDGPVFIDCQVEQEENVFPMIPSGQTVHDTIG